MAGGSTEKEAWAKADCAKALLYWQPLSPSYFLRAFYKGKCMETHVRKIILWLPGIQKRKISLNKLYRDSMKAAEVKPLSKDIVFTIDSIGTDAGIRGRLLEEFSLNLKIDHDKNKTAGYVSVEFMDNELVDALFYRDRKTVGFGIPLLYDDYFRCDIDKLLQPSAN